MLGAGAVQGANMFYHRAVFAGAGTFNDNMGAGMPFAREDFEMSARSGWRLCRRAGTVLQVTHRHGRLIGSAEANKTVELYDHGRGAFYASMINCGFPEILEVMEASSLAEHQAPGLPHAHGART